MLFLNSLTLSSTDVKTGFSKEDLRTLKLRLGHSLSSQGLAPLHFVAEGTEFAIHYRAGRWLTQNENLSLLFLSLVPLKILNPCDRIKHARSLPFHDLVVGSSEFTVKTKSLLLGIAC